MTDAVRESVFQRKLIDAVGSDPLFRVWRQLNGNLYWRDREGNYFPVSLGPPEGAADITGFVWGSGRRIELEVKSATGRLSAQQKRWEAAMNAGGPIHLVAKYNADWTLERNVDEAMFQLRKAASRR